MPTGLHLWSRTAASNATADSSINWAEGQSPSSVNDSARAMMARVAEWRDDLGGVSTSGSATAYSVSTNRGFASAAVMDKAIITIIPHVVSGAAPTLTVDGLTARPIRAATGVSVPTGALVAGTPYALIYLNSTTEFILLGVVATLGSLDITGATAITTPDTADEIALYDASAAVNRKITLGNLFKVIDTFTAKTAPAAVDELGIYDVAGASAKKVTLTGLFAAIDSLTAKASPAASDEVVIYDAAGATSKKSTLAQVRTALPAMTISYLTSGTGATYTTPANCRAIKVRMIGGGGGGGAQTTGGAAGAGGTTTFNSINANGGGGGPNGASSAQGGTGGNGGSGFASLRLAGGDGMCSCLVTSTPSIGNGGAGAFGGAGSAGVNGAGSVGKTNTGGGGGGGHSGSSIGGGGGAGEYVEIVILSPSATYTYTVGAGGTGGTGGNAGGNGGSGLIIVEEYY